MADTVESLRERIAALEAHAEELERAVIAAEKHSRRLEDLVRGVPGILWEANGLPGELDQQNTFISEQVETMLGYRVDESLGTPGFWTSIMLPEDRERMTRASSTITTGLRLGRSESRVLTRDGQEVWLEIFLSAVKDEAGAVVGVRGVALDVSRRKRMEAERAAMQDRLEHLLLSSHIVLFSFTPQGELNFISDNVLEQFGYPASDFLGDGKFWVDRVHPDDLARARAEVVAVRERGQITHKYRFRHSDGTYRWVQGYLRVVRDAEGSVTEVAGTWQDVTLREEAEQTILAQAATLLELSTPIIPISDRVLAMPLIGAVSAERAEQVLATMLDGISKTRAEVAILDITGVKEVDHQVAEALVRVAHAVQLLGAELVLTGIRPEVAQTLVTLGADLGKIVTCGTLAAGITYATRRATSGPGPRSPADRAPPRARGR